MDSIELILYFLKKIIAIYAIAWSITGVIVWPLVSLGSFKRIIYIDKQLAGDLGKYYDHNGYMRPKYQLSWEISTRLCYYCLAYPFIRKRVSTDSKKFKAFMWWNAGGMWIFWGFMAIGIFVNLFPI